MSLKSPHILLASSNSNKMLSNLRSFLDHPSCERIQEEINKNVKLLFELGLYHYDFAKSLQKRDWRQRISRFYYGAYNLRRAIRLHESGSFSTEVDDHKKNQLPDDFNNASTYAVQLPILRDDRNLADYDHTAVESDLVLTQEDVEILVKDFFIDSRAYLTSRGVLLIMDKNIDLIEVLSSFKRATRFSHVDYEVKERSGGNYLLIFLANTTDRFFSLLEQSLEALPEDNPYKYRTTLKKRAIAPGNRLKLPETQFLRTTLSESLTVTQFSFSDNFSARYIRSVSGDEEQIVSHGNHIVYGRRGAGKSSLLAYLMHDLRQEKLPYAWVTIQTYSGRSDLAVIAEVLIDITNQIKAYSENPTDFEDLLPILETISDSSGQSEDLNLLNRILPKIRRIFGQLAAIRGNLFLFLDDIHVISELLQPVLLDKLYSIARGNRIYLKISGIEQFVKLRDVSLRQGMETPGDIQVVRLDYNLTMPDKSRQHIHEILNSHAVYCGLQNVDYICGDGVIDRLVWVAAGVPRDALYLFSQAISESGLKNYKKVSISSINVAASEMTQEKLRDVKVDASGKYDEVNKLLDSIRNFCVTEQRKNVFLIEIQSENPVFQMIEELIALRLLHILSAGLTPREVGRRYMALMLDYGFYVGFRAARAVDLFAKEPKPLQVQELRKFPTFPLSANVSEVKRQRDPVNRRPRK